MLSYLFKRILMAVPSVAIVTVLVFAMIRAIPGDPAALMLGDINDPALLAQMRHQFGLDRSLPEQFMLWIVHLLHGDLGMSIVRHQPVGELIRDTFPVTAQIVLAATALAALIAIPPAWWPPGCRTGVPIRRSSSPASCSSRCRASGSASC